MNALSLRRFAIYVFDYGAPVGFNLAVTNPDRITAIDSQNGNAYEEGLGAGAWALLRAYWRQPSPAIRETIKERMSFNGDLRGLIFRGVNDRAAIEPEAHWLDAALLARPGMMDIQADLKLDYKANIERYPLYQQYLRTHRPPLLAIWGKNDTFFIHQAPRRSSVTCQMRMSDFWTPVTLLLKPTSMTLPRQSWKCQLMLTPPARWLSKGAVPSSYSGKGLACLEHHPCQEASEMNVTDAGRYAMAVTSSGILALALCGCAVQSSSSMPPSQVTAQDAPPGAKLSTTRGRGRRSSCRPA